MAQLILSSTEPAKVLKLVEQLFPGVDLKIIEGIISGIELDGTLNATDTASGVTLSVTINKAPK